MGGPQKGGSKLWNFSGGKQRGDTIFDLNLVEGRILEETMDQQNG